MADPGGSRRIGLFGGSFDPVHLGHLWIAEAARETLTLDQVRWIPAATNPLKRSGPIAGDAQRLEMVRLAIAGHPQFVVDDREIRRGEISYTIDTVKQIRDEHPDAELFLIIGSDSLATFAAWREPRELLSLVTPATVYRGGAPEIDFGVLAKLTDPARVAAAESAVVRTATIELSSTEIRQRIASGRSIRYRVPAAVSAYLGSESVYR